MSFTNQVKFHTMGCCAILHIYGPFDKSEYKHYLPSSDNVFPKYMSFDDAFDYKYIDENSFAIMDEIFTHNGTHMISNQGIVPVEMTKRKFNRIVEFWKYYCNLETSFEFNENNFSDIVTVYIVESGYISIDLSHFEKRRSPSWIQLNNIRRHYDQEYKDIRDVFQDIAYEHNPSLHPKDSLVEISKLSLDKQIELIKRYLSLVSIQSSRFKKVKSARSC